MAAGVAGYFLLSGGNLALPWLAHGVAGVVLGATRLLRFGLVSLIAAALVSSLLLTFPVTPRLTLWYADAGLLGLVAAILLGLFGWRAARRAAV